MGNSGEPYTDSLPCHTDGSNQRGIFYYTTFIEGVNMAQEDVKDVDVWREGIQHDINEIKQKQQQNESKLTDVISDVHKLQVSDQLQNQEILTLKESLRAIQDDTSWIRRKITGALITASITAVVAGIIGVAIANIF